MVEFKDVWAPDAGVGVYGVSGHEDQGAGAEVVLVVYCGVFCDLAEGDADAVEADCFSEC